MEKYNIIYFNKLNSTNTYLKENYKDLKEGTVVCAACQICGRGREKRIWKSSEDSLTFSILLRPDKEDLTNLSLLFGLAVSNAIDKYIKTTIKWPNDIMIGDKKVAGLLAESIISNSVDAYIMGIGVNVNNSFFEDDIKDKATSIKLELNKEIIKEELLKDILDNFYNLFDLYKKKSPQYIEDIRKKNYLYLKEGYINGELVKVIDIDDNGNLKVIDRNNNISTKYYGEFSLTSFYK